MKKQIKKFCKGHGRELNIEEFSVHRIIKGKKYRHSLCRACRRAEARGKRHDKDDQRVRGLLAACAENYDKLALSVDNLETRQGVLSARNFFYSIQQGLREGLSTKDIIDSIQTLTLKNEPIVLHGQEEYAASPQFDFGSEGDIQDLLDGRF